MQAHFLKFLFDVNLLHSLESLSRTALNWVMAMYATHLGSGMSLSLKPLQTSTIRLYLAAASAFISVFVPNCLDARKVQDGDKAFCLQLQAVLSECERYDKKTNKREPYTIEMQRFLDQEATTSGQSDSSLASCADWFMLGLFFGFRKSEWAQPNGNTNIAAPYRDPKEKNPDLAQIAAFCWDDFEFMKGPRVISLQEFRDSPESSIDAVRLRWRIQKNGDRGQQKRLARHRSDPSLCGVTRAISIAKRFLRLFPNRDPPRDVPLALYRGKQHKVMLISDKVLEGHMRRAAAAVYKFDVSKPDEKKAVNLWSSHSLRVGACVILHVNGCSAETIKFLLRWRSDAFMEYLRNLTALSNVQNKAMKDTDLMPQFF